MTTHFRAKGGLITNRGPVRSHNEDACLFGRVYASVNMEAAAEEECLAENGWVIAVADGLGGHRGGERASAALVTAMGGCHEITPAGIAALLDEENGRLVEMGATQPELRGMGATVAGIAWREEGLFAFNVGDARVYRYNEPFLAQVTEDDSVAQILIDAGGVDENDARKDAGGRLTQAVGGKTEFRAIEVHIYPIEVRRPTRFLVCSDGLTDCLALDQIEETVNVGNDLLETVNRLYQAAHNAGSRDNVTILWLEISDKEGVMNV